MTIGVVGIALLGTFQVLRTPGDLTESAFWARKTLWADTFDVVMAGDSRTYQGISPAAVSVALPGARIANFGFSSAALGAAYLERVDSLLSHSSKRPIVVLAVTPHALTDRALRINGYAALAGAPNRRLAAIAWLSWVRRFFAPLSVDEIAVMLRDRSAFVGANVYHDDGWVESTATRYAVPPAFDWARTDFEGNAVSPILIAALAERVRAWRTEGVEVYAFVMPVDTELARLEERLSGFDRNAVAATLQGAGAVWLTPPDGLTTYDGSHLTSSSAVGLSRWLGGALGGRR